MVKWNKFIWRGRLGFFFFLHYRNSTSPLNVSRFLKLLLFSSSGIQSTKNLRLHVQQNHIYIFTRTHRNACVLLGEQTSASDGLIPENTPHCHLTGASHHAFFVRLRLIFYRFQSNKRLTELPCTLLLIYFIQRLPFPMLSRPLFCSTQPKKYFLPIVQQSFSFSGGRLCCQRS